MPDDEDNGEYDGRHDDDRSVENNSDGAPEEVPLNLDYDETFNAMQSDLKPCNRSR